MESYLSYPVPPCPQPCSDGFYSISPDAGKGRKWQHVKPGSNRGSCVGQGSTRVEVCDGAGIGIPACKWQGRLGMVLTARPGSGHRSGIGWEWHLQPDLEMVRETVQNRDSFSCLARLRSVGLSAICYKEFVIIWVYCIFHYNSVLGIHLIYPI